MFSHFHRRLPHDHPLLFATILSSSLPISFTPKYSVSIVIPYYCDPATLPSCYPHCWVSVSLIIAHLQCGVFVPPFSVTSHYYIPRPPSILTPYYSICYYFYCLSRPPSSYPSLLLPPLVFPTPSVLIPQSAAFPIPYTTSAPHVFLVFIPHFYYSSRPPPQGCWPLLPVATAASLRTGERVVPSLP